MMLKECNMIISYLFYNQTDKNGAYKKESVRLWKFIYEVLNLALCANLNKWYRSHSVIFSFQPTSLQPLPADSPKTMSLDQKLQDWIVFFFSLLIEWGYLYPAGVPPRGD